ncbi:monooxygenase [Pleurocapsa sp. CCALA 161]|uniref:FAD-dependent monooxygenase n=1 Tax=Pleurocapsa sp. CCALA 161 TaxID=2107688 RepID=UPI000D05D358|nr:FAD-dependent monooxygenase [Pleurocapsa sp. CCALA 161]PSB12234.1 monooxygenase [Pleurocapsa sp. CCALA 161]
MQVIIVGAGPTGAGLALMLVKKGIKVKLIEASRDFKRQFRGEGLMPSGLDALEQMDLLKLLSDIPHRTIDAWEFLLSHRSLFKVNEPIEATGKRCTTVVSQPHLLSAIIQQAKTHSQFEFIQGEAVQDLLSVNNRICGVKLGSGTEINADLVIAADGRNSIIRQKAGIDLTKLQSSMNILWFKLDSGALSQSSNIFYSIIQGKNAFGMFRGSSGQLHFGWGLHADDNYNWKTVNWVEKLVATSPPWLAEHILKHQTSLTQPLLLSVVVGRCDRWSIPGLLLLGDAVHPMSPIRAQGINMAFRDAIVAANHLVPILSNSAANLSQIDAVLPLIQQEREPEIIRIQQLQAEEMGQAELLHNSALVRWGAKTFAPIIRPGIKYSWLKRQKQLRQGVTKVTLKADSL